MTGNSPPAAMPREGRHAARNRRTAAVQALLMLLQQILHRNGYTPRDAGTMAALLILCGVVGAGVRSAPDSTCWPRLGATRAVRSLPRPPPPTRLQTAAGRPHWGRPVAADVVC